MQVTDKAGFTYFQALFISKVRGNIEGMMGEREREREEVQLISDGGAGMPYEEKWLPGTSFREGEGGGYVVYGDVQPSYIHYLVYVVWY